MTAPVRSEQAELREVQALGDGRKIKRGATATTEAAVPREI
jgi:hypothetical protein